VEQLPNVAAMIFVASVHHSPVSNVMFWLRPSISKIKCIYFKKKLHITTVTSILYHQWKLTTVINTKKAEQEYISVVYHGLWWPPLSLWTLHILSLFDYYSHLKREVSAKEWLSNGRIIGPSAHLFRLCRYPSLHQKFLCLLGKLCL
jgi:hypothetical protein